MTCITVILERTGTILKSFFVCGISPTKGHDKRSQHKSLDVLFYVVGVYNYAAMKYPRHR